MSDTFKIIIPAELEKAENGEWKVHGLASTDGIDKQGETIIQKGIDMSPVEEGRGILNWDHNNSPENIIGVLDGYKQTGKGLYVSGRLFKNHARAKAVHEIMSSLSKGDQGRMGMSVEGKILERDPKNHNVIKKCQIKAVALTMNPVNADTHCDVLKSLNASSIDFNATEMKKSNDEDEEPTMKISQVVAMIEKALGVSGAYANSTPGELQGGDAMSQEDMDKKKKKHIPADVELNEKKEEPITSIKKSLRRLTKSEYSYNMREMLGNLQSLYPQHSRTFIWDCIKDRLDTRYPNVGDYLV